MNKFEKTMKQVFGRLDKIETKLKEGPPHIEDPENSKPFQLLKEHYDKKFSEIRADVDALKEQVAPAREGITQGWSLLDILFKWPDHGAADGDNNNGETDQNATPQE
jgi:hypothetical protein